MIMNYITICLYIYIYIYVYIVLYNTGQVQICTQNSESPYI